MEKLAPEPLVRAYVRSVLESMSASKNVYERFQILEVTLTDKALCIVSSHVENSGDHHATRSSFANQPDVF